MSNMANECPRKQTLAEFLGGRLSDSQLILVEQHLSECDSCGDTIRGLNVDDTLIRLAKSVDAKFGSVDASSNPDDVIVDRLIDRLQDESVVLNVMHDSTGTADVLGRARDCAARVAEVQTVLRPGESDDELGRIAHYRIMELLGVGAMGVVFLAEDTQLQRNVALKILRPSLGEAARQRFLMEAQAMAAIDHDCIITVYQVGQEGPLAFIAMQHLNGETLEDRLRRESTIESAEAIQIGSQIAEGLAAAHAKDMIHRDIKPANIWLESDRDRAKILDFGLARAVNENPDLTETGMIAGTPAFMSPEQASGLTIDERSDLFSLGGVLYRMATGKLPFQANNALAMLHAIQRHAIVDPRDLNPSVSDLNADIANWLLEKDPRDRPQSALQVQSALQGEIEIPAPVRRRDRQSTKSTTAGGASRFKLPWKWWFTAVVLIAIGFVGIQYAPQIIRIVTNKGVIEIDAPDENVTIEILADDQVVGRARAVDSKEIEIKAGRYTVRLKDSGKHELESDSAVVTRGGRTRILVRPRKSIADGTGVQPEEMNSATYGGKTARQWLTVLHTDRQVGQLAFAIRALRTLEFEGIPQQEVLQALLSVVGRHGVANANMPGHAMTFGSGQVEQRSLDLLNGEVRLTVRAWGAKTTIDFVRDCIDEGTTASIAFPMYLTNRYVDGESLSDQKMIFDVESLAKELKPRFEETTIGLAKHFRISTDKHTIQAFATFGHLYELANPKLSADSNWSRVMMPRMNAAIKDESPISKFCAIKILSQIAPKHPGISTAALELLQPDTSDFGVQYGLGAYPVRSAEGDAVIYTRVGVRPLYLAAYVVIQQDEKLCQQVVPYITTELENIAFRYQHALAGPVIQPPDVPPNAEVFEAQLGVLRKAGASAKDALPSLAAAAVPLRQEFKAAIEATLASVKSKLNTNELAEVEAAIQSRLKSKTAGAITVDEPADSNAKSVTGKPVPMYDGRTFDEWLSVLRVERKSAQLTEAVRAVRAIDLPDRKQEFIDAILPVIERHGRKDGLQPESPLAFEIGWTVWTYGAESVLDTVEILLDGNQRSRDFALSLLYDDQHPYRRQLFNESKLDLRRLISARFEKLASRLYESMKSERQTERVTAFQTFYRILELSFSPPAKRVLLNGTEILIPALQDENRFISLTAAKVIVQVAPDTEGLTEAIKPHINTNSRFWTGYSTCSDVAIDCLVEMKELAAPLVPEVVDVFMSRHPIQEITMQKYTDYPRSEQEFADYVSILLTNPIAAAETLNVLDQLSKTVVSPSSVPKKSRILAKIIREALPTTQLLVPQLLVAGSGPSVKVIQVQVHSDARIQDSLTMEEGGRMYCMTSKLHASMRVAAAWSEENGEGNGLLHLIVDDSTVIRLNGLAADAEITHYLIMSQGPRFILAAPEKPDRFDNHLVIPFNCPLEQMLDMLK